MWGGFMDKAKNLAATLDKQLDESVGLDGDGDGDGDGTTGTAVNTDSSLLSSSNGGISTGVSVGIGGGIGSQPSANISGGVAEEDDNVWNDDFGFDDDDEDADDDPLPPASQAQMLTPVPPVVVPAPVPAPAPAPTPPAAPLVVVPPTTTTTTPVSLLPTSISPPPRTNPPPPQTPIMKSSPVTPVRFAASSPPNKAISAALSPLPSPAHQQPASWEDQENDMAVGKMEDFQQFTAATNNTNAKASISPVEASSPAPALGSMLSSFAKRAEASLEQSLLQTPAPTPVAVAAASQIMENTTTVAAYDGMDESGGWKEEENDQDLFVVEPEAPPQPAAVSSSPTNNNKAPAAAAAAFGSMLSSFAKKAEASLESTLAAANDNTESKDIVMDPTAPVEAEGWDEPEEEEDVDFQTDQDDATIPPTEEEATPAPAPSTPAALGSMFSSLAKQAEASFDIGRTSSNSQQQESPRPAAAAAGARLTSLLSSFPGTKTQQQPPPDEAPTAAGDGGWNGVDLDIPNDDEPSMVEKSAAAAAAPLSPSPPQDMPVPELVSSFPVASQQPTFVAPANSHSARSPIPPEPAPVVASNSASGAAPILNIEDDPRYQLLREQLRLREDQLANKSEQLTQLQMMADQQEQDLRQKITDTKEEAKKRILRAKERFEAAETKAKSFQSAGTESSAEQGKMIAELRQEGQKLAMKQSQMEQAVRNAKIESRDFADSLDKESRTKTQALEKLAKVEAELKVTKESLNYARKGESQAGKLESDLLAARSDAEMKASTIMSLQQQIKELSSDGKELRQEIEKIRKMATQEANHEKKTLRREHNDIITDLEQKLRTTEREAGVREDALRHEVSELRKRWQDAVRRADALSMDVQSSTAPLLRQLESMERQNRARSAAWAELETRLRSELEETVIQNETLSKERSEFKTKYTRLERSVNERETELKESKRAIEDQIAKIAKLEAQVMEMEVEAEKRQEEYGKVERLANEGVMRVRSEMTQTVVDSEERYRGQIDKLEGDLRVEHERRNQLEGQVANLLGNAGMIVAPQAPEVFRRETKPKKLRKADGQAEILAGALGLDSDEEDEDDNSLGQEMDRGANDIAGNQQSGMDSFAALEQLTSRLKSSMVELQALRRNLRDSESIRESLVQELGESRTAREKLPLFEVKVKELTEENQEMELEIQGLRYDIAEVRELYRTQLNVLLEEKAALYTAMNGDSAPSSDEPELDQPPNKPEETAEIAPIN